MRADQYARNYDVTWKMTQLSQQFYLRLIRLIIYRNFN